MIQCEFKSDHSVRLQLENRLEGEQNECGGSTLVGPLKT